MRNRPRLPNSKAFTPLQIFTRKFVTGFTLLELLVTALLISVVMGVVASVFSGGLQVWGRGEDATQKHQQLRFIRYRLGLDLRNAISFSPVPMEGSVEMFRFVLAERSRQGDRLELKEVRYRVNGDPERQRLVRTSASLLTGEEKEELLLEACSRIQFSYSYRGAEGEVLWKEAWKENPQAGDVPRWVRTEILQDPEIPVWVQIFSLPRGVLTEEAREEEVP